MSLLVVTPAAPATVSSLIGTLRGVADILCKEPNALLISFHLKLMSSAKKKKEDLQLCTLPHITRLELPLISLDVRKGTLHKETSKSFKEICDTK